MASKLDLVKFLQLTHPLIVAPMAGGPSSPELVAAASNAGALGSMGAAYSTPDAMSEFVTRVRAKTNRPFAMNLFVPHEEPKVSLDQKKRALEATRPFRNEFGLPDPEIQPPFEENFDAQFERTLSLKPAVLSFVFGQLAAESIRAAQAREIYIIGTATSPEEAKQLEASGVDAIVLQGIEAGGHRGIFDKNAMDPEIGVLSLLESCVGRVKLPLIAAGGMMNAQSVRNALGKGAQAVQLGTAFLACEEAGTSKPYREALLKSEARLTKTTRAFSGRLARGIQNKFMIEMDRVPNAILPFPAQNKFTRDLRGASAKSGSSEFLSLWAGTGEGPLWTGKCADLIQSLFC